MIRSKKNLAVNNLVATASVCRILVVEDHQAIAQLLADFLNSQENYALAGVVHDPVAALDAAAAAMPDLIILDIGLPDKSAGLGLIDSLRVAVPSAKILVFSALSTMQVVRQALQSGAHGFLEKSAPFPELVHAIEQVSSGQTYLGAHASAMLREAVISDLGQESPPTQELAVLRLLGRGLVVKEIAEELHLSNSMIYKLIDRLRTKFDARTNEDLVLIAVERGWIEIQPRAQANDRNDHPPV